ncbi:MAG TPA: hypothetical protein VE135_20875 [Pyrinomonadaceae bacterium]|nr:hypothetical protein [Pyrinomonadaceae bacterium]
MTNLIRRAAAATFVLLLLPPALLAQRKNKTVVCKSDVFAVAKPLPQLTYQCPANATSDSDDIILKSPDRLKAIDRVIQELRSFTGSRWWDSPVTDLNVCYLHGSVGTLSADEVDQLGSSEYQASLLGDNRLRLVVLADPCYQTSYNGANAFILYRKGQKVYVTQVLDGYYSRLGKSIFLHVLYTHAGPSIRIETANISGMQPETLNYYFVIDKVTNKAVPRKLPRRSKVI